MLAFTALFTLLPLALANPLIVRDTSDTCSTCDPHPLSNLCDETTSCALIGEKTYCACRGGYRANTAAAPGDSSVQWRLSAQYQEGRVFVAPGVTCDTLCDHWELGPDGCQEVTLKEDC